MLIFRFGTVGFSRDLFLAQPFLKVGLAPPLPKVEKRLKKGLKHFLYIYIMPNWCHNHTCITCPTKDLYDKLIESIENEKWFSTFAPLEFQVDENGEEIWDMTEAYSKWGTKWEPNELELRNCAEEDLCIELSYDTAWCPPLEIYKTMYSTNNILVTTYYYESGEETFGKYDSEDGDLFYSYPSNKEELMELRVSIPEDIYCFMESEWENLQELWGEESTFKKG